MHRSRRFAALILTGIALAALAAVTPVRATEIAAKSWELGGDVVFTRYDNDTTMDDTLSLAVRVGWALRSKHMFELHLNTQSADPDDKDSSDSFDIMRTTINYIGNFKSKKPDSKFAAYGLFGVGIMSIDADGGSDSSTLFRGGGGVRYFFTKSIALRIEGALAHFHGDGQAIPQRSYFDFDFGVGVSFLLGGD